MTPENSNMAGSSFFFFFFFLVLASVFQGYHHHSDRHFKQEAIEGQNITLPCFVENKTADLTIVHIEWQKNVVENKLVVYSPAHGQNRNWVNVTMEIVKDGDNVKGSYLHLPMVTKWDSGFYTCDTVTFPKGSIKMETEVTIKDKSIICNVAGPEVEVRQGEDLTIECHSSLSNTQYSWTLNKMVMSENKFLKLKQVTDVNAGVYAFHVTGKHNLSREFNITVRTTSTASLKTDLKDIQAVTFTTESSLATSPTSSPSNLKKVFYKNQSTIATSVAPVEKRMSLMNSSQISVTSFPSKDSNTSHLLNPTESNHHGEVYGSTHERGRYETELHTSKQDHPEPFSPEWTATSEDTIGNTPKTDTNQTPNTNGGLVVNENKVQVNKDKGSAPSHSLLVTLVLIPVVILLAVAGLLCRRQIRKRRMDGPPPFKPPPPPVKYTAPRYTATNSAL